MIYTFTKEAIEEIKQSLKETLKYKDLILNQSITSKLEKINEEIIETLYIKIKYFQNIISNYEEHEDGYYRKIKDKNKGN